MLVISHIFGKTNAQRWLTFPLALLPHLPQSKSILIRLCWFPNVPFQPFFIVINVLFEPITGRKERQSSTNGFANITAISRPIHFRRHLSRADTKETGARCSVASYLAIWKSQISPSKYTLDARFLLPLFDYALPTATAAAARRLLETTVLLVVSAKS